MKTSDEKEQERLAGKAKILAKSLAKIRLAESYPVQGGTFATKANGGWFPKKKATMNKCGW